MKPNHLTQALAVMIAAMWCHDAQSQTVRGADYLAHALEAERFISSLKIETPDGVLWRTSPESGAETSHTFYHGSGGAAIFYLELYQATSEQRFLETAVNAGNEIIASAAKDEQNRIGMYSGLSGDVFVLSELHKHTKDDRFRDAARRALSRIKSLSEELGSGVGWIETIHAFIDGKTGGLDGLDGATKGLHQVRARDDQSWGQSCVLAHVAQRPGEMAPVRAG